MTRFSMLITLMLLAYAHLSMAVDFFSNDLNSQLDKNLLHIKIDALRQQGHRPSISDIENLMKGYPSGAKPISLIREIYRLNSAFGAQEDRENQFKELNSRQDDFRKVLNKETANIISAFEGLSPNGIYIGIGRDSTTVVDILDSYYRAIGDMNRVRIADLGRDSFQSLDLLKDYLKQLGYRPSELSLAQPLVFFDSTNFGPHSQSRILLKLIVEMCLTEPNCKLEELFKKVHFVNIGASREMYNKNILQENPYLVEKIYLTNLASKSYEEIPSILVPEAFLYNQAFHGPYTGLKKDPAGIIEPEFKAFSNAEGENQLLTIAQQILIASETKNNLRSIRAKVNSSTKAKDSKIQAQKNNLLPGTNRYLSQLEELRRNLITALSNAPSREERYTILDNFLYMAVGFDHRQFENATQNTPRRRQQTKKSPLNQMPNSDEEDETRQGSVKTKISVNKNRFGVKSIDDAAQLIHLFSQLYAKELIEHYELYALTDLLLARGLLVTDPGNPGYYEALGASVTREGIKKIIELGQKVAELNRKDLSPIIETKMREQLFRLETLFKVELYSKLFPDAQQGVTPVAGFYVMAAFGFDFINVDLYRHYTRSKSNAFSESGSNRYLSLVDVYCEEFNKFYNLKPFEADLQLLTAMVKTGPSAYLTGDIVPEFLRERFSKINPQEYLNEFKNLLTTLNAREDANNLIKSKVNIFYWIYRAEGADELTAYNKAGDRFFSELKESTQIEIPLDNLPSVILSALISIRPSQTEANPHWAFELHKALTFLYQKSQKENNPPLAATKAMNAMLYTFTTLNYNSAEHAKMNSMARSTLLPTFKDIVQFERRILKSTLEKKSKTFLQKLTDPMFSHKIGENISLLARLADDDIHLLQSREAILEFLTCWQNYMDLIIHDVGANGPIRFRDLFDWTHTIYSLIKFEPFSNLPPGHPDIRKAHELFEYPSEAFYNYIINFDIALLDKPLIAFFISRYGEATMANPFPTRDQWDHHEDFVPNQRLRLLNKLFTRPDFTAKDYRKERFYIYRVAFYAPDLKTAWIDLEFQLFVKDYPSLSPFELLAEIESVDKDLTLLIKWYDYEKARLGSRFNDELMEKAVDHFEKSMNLDQMTLTIFYRHWLDSMNPSYGISHDNNFKSNYAKSSIFRSVWNEDAARRKIDRPNFCTRSLMKIFKN